VASPASPYTWLPNLPSDCPPTTAVPSNGTFFRLVRTDPPSQRDFLTPAQISPSRLEASDDVCPLHALSVFADPADARTAIAILPGMRNRRVAQGVLEPWLGLLQRTPAKGYELPSHHDWWMPTTATPEQAAALFVVV